MATVGQKGAHFRVQEISAGDKFGLSSRTQLALYAARTGLIALDHFGTEMAVGTIEVLRRV